MKVKFFIFSMVLGLSLAMTGCDTTTESLSPTPEKEMEETKEEPKAMTESKSETAMPPKKEAPPVTVTMAPEGASSKKMPVQSEPSNSTVNPIPEKKVPQLSIKKDEKSVEKPKIEAPLAQKPEPIPELRVIYFEFDKSDIQGQFIEDLKYNWAWIKNNPNVRIQLEGHADERGTNDYNLALGERRGNSVLDYLMALGANLDQLSVISFGEERPARLGCSDEDCYGNNRRVEFTRL